MPKAPRNRRPNVLRLIYPFWTAGKDWRAWGLLVYCLAYSVGGVYLAVRTNTLAGALIDAMVKRQWSALWPVLVNTLGIGMAALIGSIASYAALAMLNLRWRTWMTHHYLSAWTRNGAYYTLERDELISNADERISQDIQTFLQDTLTLSFNLLSVIITVVAFTAVLWNLSGTLRFPLFGYRVSIAGYMVYVAFLYQAISFLITHYSGRALIRLLSDKQTVEADFRYRGMQLRENAEQVAFYGGGRREEDHLRELFRNILANWRSIIMVTSRMMFFQGVYVQSRSLVPTVAALPRYLAGKITLGAVTRITGAFNQLSEALSFFSQAYQTFSEWLAVGQRLSDLSMVLSMAGGGGSDILVGQRPEPSIDVDGLSLRLPSGELMATVPSLKISRGEHWLIRGRSGAGKSTLLRAIAGMWPYGSGTVRLPESESLMFLPQRSYIPSGTLKAALCYPSNPTDFDDGRCRAVLEDCMLGLYARSLDHEGRWQQKLSGGEQQRLAIARAILHRPAFLFLDEATSAQDGKSEQELYRLLLARLSGSAIISVAHHDALEAFHERVVVLTRSEVEIQDLKESEVAASVATNDLRFAAT